ncbi:MAG TPA: SGNH/GDSL hydrolase family protein [Candidatus Limnocylindrales bacterium]|jgi:phospholipase/lecithinase/hemolysin|nr:SGNH/GDSL hydrolase family protein [Candidatus Limnocylindrales bacterium]
MQQRVILNLHCIAIGLGLFVLGGSPAWGYTALVGFGDSYTDTGNVPSSAPNYYYGRYSNGPLWIEYLSQVLGFGYNAANNYALSGSESDELGVEISHFPGTADSANVLFAIWSGNNDFINRLKLGYDDYSWDTQVQHTLSSLSTATDLLYKKGARHLLLCNQLDITRIPSVLRVYDGTYRTYVRSKINSLNSQLSQALPGILANHPGLEVLLVDTFSHFNDLLNHYTDYGFTQNLIGALNDTSLTDKSFTGPGSNYVFWDNDHPTTKAHNLMAGWFAEQVAPPIIPPTIALSSPLDGSSFNAPAEISLSASVVDNGTSIDEVGFFENGILIGTVTKAPYALTWSAASPGSYSVTATVTYNGNQSVTSTPITVAIAAPTGLPVPSPWVDSDIGNVGLSGEAVYSTNGTFTVAASGADIWDTADQFHYVFRPWTGDGTIIAEVTQLQDTDGFAKAGLMFRQTLDPGSPNGMQFLAPTATGFQSRNISSDMTAYLPGSPAVTPYWLKLERVGDMFQGYTSADGTNWTQGGSVTVAMPAGIYVGLALTAHNNTALNVSTFANVQLVANPPALRISALPDRTMQLEFNGESGLNYRIDVSPDLVSWSPLQTIAGLAGTTQITDGSATNWPQRFYRAVLVP